MQHNYVNMRLINVYMRLIYIDMHHKFVNMRLIYVNMQHNTQVPSSDVITSLCGYSSVNEAWKVFVYVNGGASAIGDALWSLII